MCGGAKRCACPGSHCFCTFSLGVTHQAALAQWLLAHGSFWAEGLPITPESGQKKQWAGEGSEGQPRAGSSFNILMGFMLALACVYVTHSEETDKTKF